MHRELLARAVLTRYAAALFAEPDVEWEGLMNDANAKLEVERGAAELAIPLPRISRDDQPVRADDACEERNGLFGHTVRGACPPNELEYGRTEVFQQAQMLADLAGFYAAFSYQASGPMAERPDHVVAQLEFLSVLACKELIACQNHCDENVDACRGAQRSFLKDHLATWIPAFCARLRRQDPDGFFGQAAVFLDTLLARWCAALGVSVGPAWLELRPVEEDEASITCGGAYEPHVELGPALAAAMEGRA